MNLPEIYRISDYEWEIPVNSQSGAGIPVRIFASKNLLELAMKDRSLIQAMNSAMLPGMQRYICVMPDVHQGYGFPIGGVAASDVEKGVVTPGGIGYDINCGVRLMTTSLRIDDIKNDVNQLLNKISSKLPSGIGKGKSLSISKNDLGQICEKGVRWAVEKGLATEGDASLTEDGGRIDGAHIRNVSPRAIERGLQQMGSLGSGNHFLEIDMVDELFDKPAADRMGLTEFGIVIQVHCGSRGFGHQICSDYVREFQTEMKKFNINIPDRELVCVPIKSNAGKRYLSAMRCAANYAFCNRAIIANQVRKAFEEVFERKSSHIQLQTVYDLAHNIAKFETHMVDGKEKEVCVHRKGATRSFGPGRKEVPSFYRDIGQPVIIPGSMGTSSWVMVGTPTAMDKTFGSCCHGAGRLLSRKRAKSLVRGENVFKDLKSQGIQVQAGSWAGLAEEAPLAYKDIDEVIESVEKNELAKKVARLKPIGVIKG